MRGMRVAITGAGNRAAMSFDRDYVPLRWRSNFASQPSGGRSASTFVRASPRASALPLPHSAAYCRIRSPRVSYRRTAASWLIRAILPLAASAASTFECVAGASTQPAGPDGGAPTARAIVDELERLGRLHEKGLLTVEECAQMKTRLIS